MRLNKILLFILPLLFALTLTCNDSPNSTVVSKTVPALKPVDLVYTQLDTENSRWFLFSSASRPFGMVNLSPDTQLQGTWGSGYRYEVDTIKGFSHIHGWQLSGLSVMPVTLTDINRNSVYQDFYSKFSHKEEEVSPGYHSLRLQRYNIHVALTSTKRVGLHQYIFPKTSEKAILFNLNGILGPCEIIQGKLEKAGDSELMGSFVIAPTKRRPKPVNVFFKAELNTSISNLKKDEKSGNYLVSLDSEKDTVLMKAAISYTSVKNAVANLETELPHWDFEKTVNESKSEWNGLLGRIKVEGGTEKAQKRFYTDLWHALLGRKIISDVNGAYPDNTGDTFRIGQLPLKKDGTPQFNHYNSDAFWGAQWTINTLWGLVYPEIKKEFVLSLLQYYKDGRLIPRGPSGGNYTYVMTGASSTPFIISAIQKGLVSENLDTIYHALKKNHMPNGIMEKAGYEHHTNLGGGLRYYLDKGYVPYPIPEGKFGGHQDGASLTMEYAYQDYTFAQLAKKLGYDDDYAYFMERSKNYRNVYDSDTGWMRPKNVDGKWKTDFDPFSYENGFNESNASQSTWFVPHDLDGLAQLMGGKEIAIEKLNQQFKEAEKLNFTAGSSHDREMHPDYSRIPINYGNQPSMQTAFVFHKLGRPDLTQYWSRKVVEKVFSGLSPKTGYNGDEDQGLMASLAVLMKIGLFQMNGGTEENPEYQIGSPIFDRITIELNTDFYSGKKIEINALNNSKDNVYVDGVLFNDKPLKSCTILHEDITNGGVLTIQMSGNSSIE
ncbi:GH92 family glycosyl hydrolase [Flagellimonas sp. HMM57]|uniref:GH92 family glycosyl hydrolase n=1 Tax=Flagellimonas sp. HMM57 TaxID=2905121 RepID=UPI0013CFB728|nr:GH92 family glycosyl hydrolase [Flagellimonas sp. HMM57]UII77298.1 GH92 family glycosyl hydrolase [Flagellimonas sp. HMM57]